MPYAFTEQGIYMLATVLKGELAEQQSIFIMRAFKEMRHFIANNALMFSLVVDCDNEHTDETDKWIRMDDIEMAFPDVKFVIYTREIAHILHNACMVDGVKVNVMTAIDMMVESLKRIILDNSNEKLVLPTVLPIESMEGITE